MKNVGHIKNSFIAPGLITSLLVLMLCAPTYAQDQEPQDEQESQETLEVQEAAIQAPVEQLVDLLETDGQPHTISSIEIIYSLDITGQPAPEALLQASVILAKTSEGYVGPRPGMPTVSVRLADLPNLEEQRFYDSALPSFAPAVVEQLRKLGLIGVYVEPDPAQLAVEDGEVIDLRAPTTTSLTLQVTTGVVVDVRSNGLGERIQGEDTINHRFHQRIREHSPVRAAQNIEEGNEDNQTSLLNREKLDEYVYLMNRHPGRRIDVALVPEGSIFGGVSLDYLVTENNPEMFYAQLANTGTSATNKLQERFGYINNQFTNNDDIFSVDYLTGGFDEVHSINTSYDWRLFDDDRIRGRVFGSWYKYTAAEVGLAQSRFEGDGYSIGGEIRRVIHQNRDYFVDAFAGLRFEAANVNNQLTLTKGDGDFLLPSVGLRAERLRQSDRLRWSVWAEGNVLDNNQADLTALGRSNTDEQWVTFQYSASYSFYIEPLMSDNPAEATSLAHELAFFTRGQFSADSRLPPNYLQVAGGLNTVRGYPQAVVSGDDVILGSVEYRFHLPQGLSPEAQPGYLFGKPFRYAPQYVSGATDWDLILKAFLDVGYVDRSNATALETDNTLLGAGFGLDIEVTRRVRGEVNFGWALTEVTDGVGAILVDNGDFEVQFVVTIIF